MIMHERSVSLRRRMRWHGRKFIFVGPSDNPGSGDNPHPKEGTQSSHEIVKLLGVTSLVGDVVDSANDLAS